jgi:hypothetical protein
MLDYDYLPPFSVRRMKIVLAVAALIISLMAHAAIADDLLNPVSRYVADCRDPGRDLQQKTLCVAYLHGLIDGFDAIAPYIASKPFCPNPQQTYQNAGLILFSWAAQHPTFLGVRTSVAFIEAMKEAYPCM